MKILACLKCDGELDIISEEGIHKFVKCRSCDYTSEKKYKKTYPQPEVVIIRKRN